MIRPNSTQIERYLMCFELDGIQNMEFRTTLPRKTCGWNLEHSSLNNLRNKNKWLKHSTIYARTALLKNVHTNHKNTYEIRALTSSMPHDCGQMAGKNATMIDAKIHPTTKLPNLPEKRFSNHDFSTLVSTQL